MPTRPSLTSEHEREVLALALDLHDQAQNRNAVRDAAAELGVAPEHVARAEALVAARRKAQPPPKRSTAASTITTCVLIVTVGVVLGFMFAVGSVMHACGSLARVFAGRDQSPATPRAVEVRSTLELRADVKLDLFQLGPFELKLDID